MWSRGEEPGQEVRLEVDGFPSSSLLSGYQCPLWRHRHDFPPSKSEERHKH